LFASAEIVSNSVEEVKSLTLNGIALFLGNMLSSRYTATGAPQINGFALVQTLL
jgi:hypothetical protein